MWQISGPKIKVEWGIANEIKFIRKPSETNFIIPHLKKWQKDGRLKKIKQCN